MDASRRQHRVCQNGCAGIKARERSLSGIAPLEVDRAKDSLWVFGATADGAVVCIRSVTRPRLYQLLAEQARCVLAMDAFPSFHLWRRVAESHGHEVRDRTWSSTTLGFPQSQSLNGWAL